MKTIFVQIASYRDTELPFTIDSCLSTAKHPERISFGICWQYDEKTELDLESYQNDKRFRIDKIHYSQSNGCCWARNRTNQLYQNEFYTLQIDAHIRFEQDWDVKMIDMLETIEHDKPLLTTYPPPYILKDGVAKLKMDHGVQKLILKKLRLDLTTIQEGKHVKQTDRPGKSKLLAAGYFFTLGQFCKEVEYDPNIYFHGEEISLAARAYTHGYNLYYPHENLVWHLYNHDSPLHWMDNKDYYPDKEKQAIERLETLFLGDHTQLGKYGLGDTRTLQQFEKYSNIRFSDVIERRSSGGEPHFFNKVIRLNTDAIEQRADYEVWVFNLLDNEDRVIYRRDITDPDILQNRTDRIAIKETIKGIPTQYRIWPKAPEGWGEKYTYTIEIDKNNGENMDKIFIALAAYCEPELRLTIQNCIDRAARPDRLRFGVCLHYDNDGVEEIHDDCIDDIVAQHKIRLVKYPYTSSQGGCWARNIVQSLYRDEQYTLQVDAHSRFVDGWDNILINMMRELPSEKPLITGFPPLYFINQGVEKFTSVDDLSRVPTTKVTSWSDDGWIDHPTEYLSEYTSTPRRTRVLSGAFVFTLGRWNTEVNQDPQFLYTGEEFALSLRSYTSGYDLFNPTQIVVWHRNHPEPNRKYISDFDKDAVRQRSMASIRRLKILLQGDPRQELAPFSLGRKRTLNDYRIFSGLDCENKQIHENARKGVPPEPVTILNEYSGHGQLSMDTAGDLLDLTVQLAGIKALELQCQRTNPVVDALLAALQANIGRQADDEDPLMYLQIGDDEDHEIYFLQSRLLSLQMRTAARDQS